MNIEIEKQVANKIENNQLTDNPVWNSLFFKSIFKQPITIFESQINQTKKANHTANSITSSTELILLKLNNRL